MVFGNTLLCVKKQNLSKALLSNMVYGRGNSMGGLIFSVCYFFLPGSLVRITASTQTAFPFFESLTYAGPVNFAENQA